MKILRGCVSIFAGSVMLSGCGLDIGQIYIQLKKAGGWQQIVERAEQNNISYTTPGQGPAAAQLSNGKPALAQLDNNQKTLVDIIRNSYGDAAANEAAAEYSAMNADLRTAALSAKNDKDFLAQQQQIIKKHAANINAITLKYQNRSRK